MTQPFGGPGRQPEPSKRPPPESGSPRPRLRRAEFNDEEQGQESVTERISHSLQAWGAAVVPFMRNFLSLQLVMGVVFLSRDFFFEGRGFGKNLMGFQVVDA